MASRMEKRKRKKSHQWKVCSSRIRSETARIGYGCRRTKEPDHTSLFTGCTVYAGSVPKLIGFFLFLIIQQIHFWHFRLRPKGHIAEKASSLADQTRTSFAIEIFWVTSLHTYRDLRCGGPPVVTDRCATFLIVCNYEDERKGRPGLIARRGFI